MSFRLYTLGAALPLLIALGGCSMIGQESKLPVSNDSLFAASDPTAAKTAADQCANYDMKAVPAGTTTQGDTPVVRFVCKR